MSPLKESTDFKDVIMENEVEENSYNNQHDEEDEKLPMIKGTLKSYKSPSNGIANGHKRNPTGSLGGGYEYNVSQKGLSEVSGSASQYLSTYRQ